MNLIRRFENALKTHRLLRPGGRVMVACSGGPDSTALFYLLRGLAPSWKLKLALVHFNHRWRGEASDRDERFVRELGRKFKVPVYVGRFSRLAPHRGTLPYWASTAPPGPRIVPCGDRTQPRWPSTAPPGPRIVPCGDRPLPMGEGKKRAEAFYPSPLGRGLGEGRLSPEEAARKERYEFFQRAAKRFRRAKLATAHTLEDQAETVLMRILQGTGLRGLLGIRPRVKMGNLFLVRPLLGFSKKDLLAFLREKKISFREDETNNSRRFLRNRIRLELLPRLGREFNPKVVEALARIPAVVSREAEVLKDLDRAAWKRAVKKISAGKVEFDRKALLKFPGSLQFRLLERGLRKLDPASGVSFEAWEKIRAGLSLRRFRRSLPRDIDFILTRSAARLDKKIPKR